MSKILLKCSAVLLAACFVTLSFSPKAATGAVPEGIYPAYDPATDPGGTDEADTGPIVFNRPDVLRAAQLVPGVDFLLGDKPTAESVMAEIDGIVEEALGYGLNAFLIEDTYEGEVIYRSELHGQVSVLNEDGSLFDTLGYFIEKAGENDLFVYLLHDVKASLGAGGALIASDLIDDAAASVRELCLNYKFTGLTLTGYDNVFTESAYSIYRGAAPQMSLEDWLRDNTYALMRELSATVKRYNKTLQVGALLDSVWQYYSERAQDGLPVKGEDSSYDSAFADTRAFVQEDLLHYAIVKNTASLTDKNQPFAKVAEWWAGLCEDCSVPLYLLLANDKVTGKETGWLSPDQLVKQLIQAEKYKSYGGCVMRSWAGLRDDPGGSTTALFKYFNGDLNIDQLFTELTLHQPKETVFTTYEDKVVFFGKSDSNFDLTVGGTKIQVSKNGEFSQTVDLKVGSNTVVFEHKGKKVTYRIERKVQLFREVTPTGQARLSGGTQLSVTALVYRGAQVTASLGGMSIGLTEASSEGSESSLYTIYVGTFNLPSATSSEQNLGNIQFSATWQGVTQGATGALVVINPTVDYAVAGEAVVVTAERAETFPAGTTDDLSAPVCNFLPRGTVDFVVGSVTYPTPSRTFTYYILKSGKRVYTWDVEKIADPGYTANKITGATCAINGMYTDVVIDKDWAVPFNLVWNGISYRQPSSSLYYVDNFNAVSLAIRFDYTGEVPAGGVDMSASPLLGDGSWSTEAGGTVGVLTLPLRTPGRFLGFKSFYNGDGKLVLRFTNFPGSIAGARIYLDPGHGGADPGATNGSAWEAVLNRSIAERAAAILRGMGAEVRVFEPVVTDSKNDSLARRRADARAFEPHIYISMHHNSGSATASGPESYYYNPYSSRLSLAIYNAINGTIPGTGTSRGSKFSYNYAVIRDMDIAATLVEYGFISNNGELASLLQESTQQAFAERTVQGILAALG